MQLSGTFLLYDVSPLSGNPESKIKLEAVEHGHKVLKHLTEDIKRASISMLSLV